MAFFKILYVKYIYPIFLQLPFLSKNRLFALLFVTYPLLKFCQHYIIIKKLFKKVSISLAFILLKAYNGSVFDEGRKKEVNKISKYSDFLKQRKTNSLDFLIGEGNYKTTSNRFQIKNHVLDNDTILLITNNVQYFSNKDTYVLWITDDKVVYLKSWQVKEVYNFEHLGDCYIVKLNRQYFKPYQCFKNDFLMIEKEYTFDDLLEVAKSQIGNGLWFK